MKNLLLITLFTIFSIAAYSQKEVKVEKEIINGTTVTRVWVDGQEVEEGTEEYQRYATDDNEKQEKSRKKKRKGKKAKEENIIIIKEVNEVEINETEGTNGKVIIFKVDENTTGSSDDTKTVNVEVTAEDNGQKKVIIKKTGEEGEAEVEEIIINGDKNATFIVKTEMNSELDMEGIDPENIESVNVIKNENESKIIIKTKDGKVIVKEMKPQSKGEKNDKIIKVEKIEVPDFGLDNVKPEDIETIDIEETIDGKTVTIKTKDGKTIIRKIKKEQKED